MENTENTKKIRWYRSEPPNPDVGERPFTLDPRDGKLTSARSAIHAVLQETWIRHAGPYSTMT